jgi:hypothetical protein
MSHTIWRRILWVSAVAAISNVLYAVDGATLIDPSRVRNGNITPGDAPGFPVTISQPGSYILSGNLTVPDAQTTAIEITADNVTLDRTASVSSGQMCARQTRRNAPTVVAVWAYMPAASLPESSRRAV